MLSKTYYVREDLMTLYAQANIRQEIGSGELTGNVGVQAINTEQKSTGYTFVPTTRFQTLGADLLRDAQRQFVAASRERLGVPPRASREVMRPRMVDMRQAFDYGVNTSGTVPIIRGSSGNPNLRPFRANALDATIEKYFGNKAYIALQGYYKDIKSFVYLNQEVPFDYTAASSCRRAASSRRRSSARSSGRST
ncbi:TonB-dependent receptor domain-containing protein [Sphingomonas sp. MMS24-JH45]